MPYLIDFWLICPIIVSLNVSFLFSFLIRSAVFSFSFSSFSPFITTSASLIVFFFSSSLESLTVVKTVSFYFSFCRPIFWMKFSYAIWLSSTLLKTIRSFIHYYKFFMSFVSSANWKSTISFIPKSIIRSSLIKITLFLCSNK